MAAAGRIPASVKILLVPSWVVGVAVVLMLIDFAGVSIEEPFSQIVGHTVLFGAFLAPLATFVAVLVGIAHSVRSQSSIDRPTSMPRLWGAIALSWACIVAAWVMLAKIFTS